MSKLIYVAGAYRADTITGVLSNINRARKVGELVAERGWFPVVPHNLSCGLEHVGDDPYWLAHTMAVMERCDAVLVCPGYHSSEGTKGEIARAEELGIPVYYDVAVVPQLTGVAA